MPAKNKHTKKEGKRRFTPPQGKHRSLAAVMTCLLIVIPLVTTIASFFISNTFSTAGWIYLVLSMLNLLSSLLVHLKILLPAGPHRKNLLIILTVSLMCSITMVLYALGQSLAASFAAEAEIDTAIAVGAVLSGLVTTVLGVVLSPTFILFIGAAKKKSTEKIAGWVSAMLLVISAATILLNLISGRYTGNVSELLLSSLPNIAVCACTFALCMVWPVLDRPVLEKKTVPEA